MLYQIKRDNNYINLLNLNSDIFFLSNSFFSKCALFYDRFELAKAEIYLKKLKVDYTIEQYFKPKKLGIPNGTIFKRMVCSQDGQTNKQHNTQFNSRAKVSKGQGEFISDNEGLFEWEISRKDNRRSKRF
jgi:hypothetical protein